MSSLAGQVHSLSATTSLKFQILDLRFSIWQAAVVLPHARQVLETRLRKLARSLQLQNQKSQIGNEMVRLPGVAPGHSPWLGDILLLNHSRGKLRGPGASLRSGALPFQQRTNTSCYLAIPTHGFTVVLSVFLGTPPPKPLDCKIRPKSSGAHWQRPALIRAGGEPRLSSAGLCFVPGDIV